MYCIEYKIYIITKSIHYHQEIISYILKLLLVLDCLIYIMLMVPGTGLEPAHQRHCVLSAACLPFHHPGIINKFLFVLMNTIIHQ